MKKKTDVEGVRNKEKLTKIVKNIKLMNSKIEI